MDELWCPVSVVIAFILGSIIVYTTSYGGKKKKKTLLEESYEKNTVARVGVEEDVTNGSAVDVINFGAGVAGATLACALAQDGRRVHVIKRDLTEFNRIAGEIQQPGVYLKLLELDLADCVQEIDLQRIFGYVLHKDGKSTRFLYPSRADNVGWGFQKLTSSCFRFISSVILGQGVVTSVIEENGTVKGVKYKTKTSEEARAYASLTVVCDGCFSNLLRSLSNTQVDILSHFVGLVLENCDLPFPNHAHFIIADPSLILFYPISSTEMRCLIDVPGRADLSVFWTEPASSSPNVLFAHDGRLQLARLCFPFPSLERMRIGARLISAASEFMFPIIKGEGLRQTFFPAAVPAYYGAPTPAPAMEDLVTVAFAQFVLALLKYPYVLKCIDLSYGP